MSRFWLLYVQLMKSRIIYDPLDKSLFSKLQFDTRFQPFHTIASSLWVKIYLYLLTKGSSKKTHKNTFLLQYLISGGFLIKTSFPFYQVLPWTCASVLTMAEGTDWELGQWIINNNKHIVCFICSCCIFN